MDDLLLEVYKKNHMARRDTIDFICLPCYKEAAELLGVTFTDTTLSLIKLRANYDGTKLIEQHV